jgi:hypothetical protein
MKKLVLLFAVLFSCSIGLVNAQVLEDFEPIQMNLFSGGTNGALDVIPNPDPNGNTTNRVGEMVRGFDGDPWAGWFADLDEAFNPATNRYVHLWVWKPRISPVVFKLENPDTGGNTGDVFPMNAQSVENGWEELVFDFSTFSEDFNRIVLIPDFESPLTLTEDIVLYFDEMYANDDPTPGSAPVVLFEGFEPIQMNLFSAGTNGALEVIPNPDPTVNETNTVAKMTRGFDGDPWAGMFADVAEPIDPAVTPYIHVMVWKPRVSPVWFKLENPDTGGNTGDVAPMEAQSMENGWENLVFDFSGFAGEVFTRIVLLPDFEDPLTLTEDIVLYFDEIMKSDQMGGGGNVTLNIDMTDAIGYNSLVVFDPELHDVFVAGDPWGWPQPGSDPSLMLTSEDGVNYTGSFMIEDGRWQWKYFFVPKGEASWDHGEWDGTENRHHIIMGEMTFDQVWGDKPVDFTFNVDMEDADPFDPATDDVYIAGELLSVWNQPGTVEDYKMEPVEGKAMMYTITLPLYIGDHAYKYFRVVNGEPSWDNGEPIPEDRVTAVDTNMTETMDVWGSLASINDYTVVTFSMYPNPVDDVLTIDQLVEAEKIEIYNLAGTKVRTIEAVSAPSVRINTSELPAGMYMITVYHNNEVQATKFLKH